MKTPFPMLIFAAMIVAAGIYAVDEAYNSRAAWLLAFLVMLTIAFRYQHFGDELIQMFGGSPKQETNPSPASSPPIVGPTGPIVQPGNLSIATA